ncbi:MAG: hypothetical protein JXR77_12840, partial [Lentisphaeria bacterium]|nr:hypothetical protein [Lentisphaeria bacterium]
MSRKHILPALLCLPGVLRCATLPVPNNSFEDGALPGDRIADGWYLWEKHPGRTEVVSVPDGAHGRTSIRVANPSAGGANITVPGGVPCRGGATYTLSAWARSDGPVAAAITLQVRDRDGQVLDHTLGGSVGLPGQVPLWTRFTMTAAVPEAGCFLSPHLVNNGGVVLWDAVQIEEGPAATPFQPTPRPSLSLATGAGGEPVIVNPGFEEGDAFPAGWEGPAEAAAARDTEVKRGAAALRLLQADTPQPWRSRPFRLDPDRDYVLSAWVRSRELDRGVAEFYVECLSPWGRVCGMIGKGKAYREAAGVFVSQTTDWQRRSARVGREDIPAGSVAGRAVCVLQPYAAGGGMAWFDDLECRPLGITGRGVLLAAGSPVEDFLLDQGSPASLAFRLYAPERRLETARMSCRVRGFFERTVLEEAVSGVFGEDGRTVLEVRLPEGLPSGHYTAVLRDADASGTVGTLTFGVLPPGIAGAGLEPDSPYGICHLTEAAFLPLAQRVGFKWTRGGPGVPWAGVEPTPGSFDFSAALAWREQLARHGLLKLDICSGIPRWALQELEGVVVVRGGRSRRSRAGLSLPRDLEAWGRYIETAARTLSGFGGAWEIWNEADIPGFWADSDENYLRLLRAGHAAAKRGDPKAPLLMTGVTGGFFPATQTRLDPQTGREVNPGRFFERVLAEAGDAFDVINFHSYGGAELLEARLQKARELAARHALADRPIWITETGGPTHIQSRSFSEAEQAILYLQTHVLARAYGVRKVFWHCFYDWGRDITYHEHNFGLIHYDRTPKPALLVQAALARWFGAPAFVRTRSLEDGVRCFEFEREGAPLAVLWSAAPRVLLLRTAGEPEARDCMGAEMLLPRVGEVPVLALAAEPVFLLGARIEGVLPPLVTPGAHTLSPGETGAIPVSWRNPADH